MTNESENAPDKTRLVGFEGIKTAEAAGLINIQENDNMSSIRTDVGRRELREYPSSWGSDSMGTCEERKGG